MIWKNIEWVKKENRLDNVMDRLKRDPTAGDKVHQLSKCFGVSPHWELKRFLQ